MSLGDVMPPSAIKEKKPKPLEHAQAPPAPPPPGQPKIKSLPGAPPATPGPWLDNPEEFPSLSAASPRSGAVAAAVGVASSASMEGAAAQRHPSSPPKQRAPVGSAKSGSNNTNQNDKKVKANPKPGKKRDDRQNKPQSPGASAITMLSAAPRDRDQTGDEHAFLRLMQQNQVAVGEKKGRQRLRPRKKKFSALKKRVLQERLAQWKASQGETEKSRLSCTVCLYPFAESDELEDDDEYEEIISNFSEMARNVGAVRWLYVPRLVVDGFVSTDEHPAFVYFEDHKDALAAVACWDGLVLAGVKLKAVCLKESGEDAGEEPFVDEKEWGEWCLRNVNGADTVVDDSKQAALESPVEVILVNALTEDDLEDDECMEESVTDLRAVAEKFGKLMDIRVEKIPSPPRIHVRYEGGISAAKQALNEWEKTVVGGSQIVAKLSSSPDPLEVDALSSSIFLDSVLTEDDLEDEDCLAESLNDIRELAERFGEVKDVLRDGDSTVRVVFDHSQAAAKAAVEGFNGMTIGGMIVSASLAGMQSRAEREGSSGFRMEGKTASSDPETMFSGDKRISERFAECKRAPKIPNTGEPRKYATLVDDDTVKPLLIEMLGELMRLQKRAVQDKNAKARRRLVMGLREVARGIRANKVKMVVMANNLDQYGAIDEKLQEILNLAHEAGIPVFFEFNKRGLGRAIGKSIKIAVIGIQNADGAHQPFKKLLARAPH